MSEEEKGYRIVDKRHQAGSPDGESQDEPEVTEPSAEEPSAEKEAASAQSETQEAQAVADVYGIAKWVIGIMAASAWQYMGLQVNPASGKVEKDLVQAHIAIDTVVFLADKISPHIDEANRREIRSLVNDLQVNFVRQSD